MPKERMNPLGNAKIVSVTLDPSTIHVVKHVARTRDVSFSEALRRLVLTHALQVPELKDVLQHQVTDAYQAEALINGLTTDTRQIIGERLVMNSE